MRCCDRDGPCRRTSGPCPQGWQGWHHPVPSPWVALAARPWLSLLYADIPEPGRYYDAEQCIVLRQGLLRPERRRVLWHELVHADRGDVAAHCGRSEEAVVERRAVTWALPLRSLRWAFSREATRHEAAAALQVPEDWLQFRLDGATDRELAVLNPLRHSAPEVA
ncbi:hypothetical protein NOCA2270027 [metagenome]|uniref:IrrE N-terminal-like domain-containing protein n=1 Tax=metagenome TaxID=256318 RepID=A0A2P2C3R5_9ZZZZ